MGIKDSEVDTRNNMLFISVKDIENKYIKVQTKKLRVHVESFLLSTASDLFWKEKKNKYIHVSEREVPKRIKFR